MPIQPTFATRNNQWRITHLLFTWNLYISRSRTRKSFFEQFIRSLLFVHNTIFIAPYCYCSVPLRAVSLKVLKSAEKKNRQNENITFNVSALVVTCKRFIAQVFLFSTLLPQLHFGNVFKGSTEDIRVTVCNLPLATQSQRERSQNGAFIVPMRTYICNTIKLRCLFNALDSNVISWISEKPKID